MVFSYDPRCGSKRLMNQLLKPPQSNNKEREHQDGTSDSTHHFRLSRNLVIGLVCYAPLVNAILPKTDFGPGIPDLDFVTVLSLLLVPILVFELLFSPHIEINVWLLLVFAYFCIVITSVSWSPWYAYDVGTVREIVVSTGFPVVIATLGVNIFPNLHFVHVYMRHLLRAAIIMSGICIGQFALDTTRFGDVTRAAGTLGNPNTVAVFLVLTLPAFLYLKARGHISSRLSVIFQTAVFAGLFSTVSRKGLITAAVVFVIFYMYKQQYRKVLAVIMALCVAALIAFTYSQTVAQRFATSELESQFGGKWVMMLAAIDIFEKNPIIGLGYQGYYESFYTYFHNPWVKKYDAHNEFATALANFGLVGFTIFMLIFLHPLIWARRLMSGTTSSMSTIKDNVRRHQTDMAIIAITSVIPFMMSAFYAGTLFSQNVVVHVLYLNISMMYASLRSHGRTD